MDTIFTIDDPENFRDQINLDDLYERKKQYDLNTLNTYNKILNRIHSRIKITSKQHIKEQFCFYVIPEVMIGIPRYDYEACTAYVIDKLRENGFIVKYTHPNLLFISWKHWIPSYVRTEIKKKTGVVIDGYGNKVSKNNDEANSENPQNPNDLLQKRPAIKQRKEQDYKNIDAYKPVGKLIYNDDLIKTINRKIT
tara:strand:- start:186 stop:770 length:585 start_codon:yes stop_codon:yes gene_type:complete